MNEPNSDNNQDQVFCCQPMVEESEKLKKLKPIINAGILVYVIILIVDLLYLNTRHLMTYLCLCVFLCLMSFNKCFVIFQIYTIISIILVFGTVIPHIGIIIQIKFNGSDSIVVFCINIFILCFSIVIFYFLFLAYKEMKYLFSIKIDNSSSLIPSYMSSNDQTNSNRNNYTNNYTNNNNKKGNSGFKPFSGKGTRVG